VEDMASRQLSIFGRERLDELYENLKEKRGGDRYTKTRFLREMACEASSLTLSKRRSKKHRSSKRTQVFEYDDSIKEEIRGYIKRKTPYDDWEYFSPYLNPEQASRFYYRNIIREDACEMFLEVITDFFEEVYEYDVPVHWLEKEFTCIDLIQRRGGNLSGVMDQRLVRSMQLLSWYFDFRNDARFLTYYNLIGRYYDLAEDYFNHLYLEEHPYKSDDNNSPYCILTANPNSLLYYAPKEIIQDLDDRNVEKIIGAVSFFVFSYIKYKKYEFTVCAVNINPQTCRCHIIYEPRPFFWHGNHRRITVKGKEKTVSRIYPNKRSKKKTFVSESFLKASEIFRETYGKSIDAVSFWLTGDDSHIFSSEFIRLTKDSPYLSGEGALKEAFQRTLIAGELIELGVNIFDVRVLGGRYDGAPRGVYIHEAREFDPRTALAMRIRLDDFNQRSKAVHKVGEEIFAYKGYLFAYPPSSE
jgi:hypothetical protein